MKSIQKKLSIVLTVLALTTMYACKKKEGSSSGNSDEAAAARVVGTYKGTIDITSQEYFNATIVITKESGNKVKIAAKSGEAYSNVATKIIAIKAILNSDDAEAISSPEGVVVYQHSEKAIRIVTQPTAQGEVTYIFRGTKQ
ncbi:hypothetical protein [Pedobacter sp. Hv1]|uniref:hypothetical protein n=1 Tax=Pedobacter sp. Hv1 TaxID=1740090 RepID=UPI0006D894DF|nr:hypothetical protein [Pedobacter sp. Hv1]KQC01729.1 hypothetical protein AQF98_04980 [Pedobacter sp. Hv1]